MLEEGSRVNFNSSPEADVGEHVERRVERAECVDVSPEMILGEAVPLEDLLSGPQAGELGTARVTGCKQQGHE